MHQPSDPLARFALTQVGKTIALFLQAVQTRPTPKLMSNLRFLLRLNNRAWDAVNRYESGVPPDNGGQAADSDSDSDIELLGWRTRLVERAAEGSRFAMTIPSPTVPAVSDQPAKFVNQTISNALQELLRESFGDTGPVNHDTGSTSGSLENTTNYLLTQICDPMATQGTMPLDNDRSLFGVAVS